MALSVHIFNLTECTLFSKVVPIYNLTSNVKEFPSLSLLTSTHFWQTSYLYPSDGSKMPTPCSLNFCFPAYWWDWASFNMFILHSHSLLCEMNIHILCPFVDCVVFFFVICRNSLFTLDSHLFLVTCVANIFSQLVAYLFTSFTVSFDEHRYSSLYTNINVLRLFA